MIKQRHFSLKSHRQESLDRPGMRVCLSLPFRGSLNFRLSLCIRVQSVHRIRVPTTSVSLVVLLFSCLSSVDRVLQRAYRRRIAFVGVSDRAPLTFIKEVATAAARSKNSTTARSPDVRSINSPSPFV